MTRMPCFLPLQKGDPSEHSAVLTDGGEREYTGFAALTDAAARRGSRINGAQAFQDVTANLVKVPQPTVCKLSGAVTK